MLNAKTLLLAVVVGVVLVGCGVPPPDRIEISPAVPFLGDEIGQEVTLKATAYKGVMEYGAKAKNPPPLVLTWDTTDPGIATVTSKGEREAVVKATGSGNAKVTVSVPGVGGKVVSATVEVRNMIIDSMVIEAEVPDRVTIDTEAIPFTVIIKDERGNVVEDARLKLSASDYCLDVSPGKKGTGTAKPLATGTCDVVATAGQKTARLSVTVQ
jgi:hypothetical protein